MQVNGYTIKSEGERITVRFPNGSLYTSLVRGPGQKLRAKKFAEQQRPARRIGVRKGR